MAEPVTKLAVVGAGPGGYTAAFLAADLGMEVTLIDSAPNPGGVCLFRGCIPSKALLHVAKVREEAAAAAAWGLEFGEPTLNLDTLRGWKQGVVDQLTGGLGKLCKARGVTYLQGEARFRDEACIEVELASGEAKEVRFDRAIVATGSTAIALPFLPLESPHILSSRTALDVEEIPQTMLVIGGGYIGLELGSVYAALGAEVTVVEMEKGLLPGVDRDLVRPLAKRLAGRFAQTLLETKVVEVKEGKRGLAVRFEGKNAPEKAQRFDKILVAVGRRPNTAGLGLDNLGIETDSQGFIPVDAQRRTRVPAIYAIGDVTGQPMLAHKASHEGRVAVEAIAGHATEFAPRAIPAVIFTDPEIAWAGLTETEGKADGVSYEVARFPWAASGRALSLDRTEGATKLLVDPETERILGVGIVGAGAGELIAEGVLAIEMAATVDDLRLSIHAHPTLSETLMESAEAFLGLATHIHRPPKRK